jgi:hypothetical protein
LLHLKRDGRFQIENFKFQMAAKANRWIAIRDRVVRGGGRASDFAIRDAFGESKPPQQAGDYESGGKPPFDFAQDKPFGFAQDKPHFT